MTMTYWLGIDLGTTYTAAALCRPAVDELVTHVLPLGSRSPAVPSVLFLAGDGSLVVGEGAERRALTDPDRVVREFKPRIGDEIPLLVGGVPWQAHDLAAVLVHWVWQRVTEREGQPPEGVALTCPASWGPHKIRLFMQAVQATRIGERTRLGRAELLSEPQAAAIGYASRERVEVGAHLAVYDLGGVAFNAAVVRKDSPTAFTVLGRPEGIDRLGGVTFDEMLFEHVCAAAGVPLTQIDPNDPYIVPQVARLRRECTEAKEALSVDTDTTIPVALGGVRQRVRLTRAEFEEMIRPDLDRTIEALHRALESAAVDGTQLDAILLVGGSSRIPIVSQLISAEFGRAPAIDADPKTTVAIGAARFLTPAPVPSEDSVDTAFQLPAVPPERPQMSTMLSSDEYGTAEPVRHRSRKAILGTALVALLAAGAAVGLGLPKLADELRHSEASPGTPSVGSTPAPSQSAGLAGAKPHSTGGSGAGSTTSSPARSATSSAHGQGKSQGTDGKAASSPSPVPGPTKSTPTTSPVRSSPTASAPSPTPTSPQSSFPTHTHTPPPTPTPTPTTPTPTPTTPTPTPTSPAAAL
jgi:actin-like ATPase involved in cell morphogenesis